MLIMIVSFEDKCISNIKCSKAQDLAFRVFVALWQSSYFVWPGLLLWEGQRVWEEGFSTKSTLHLTCTA